jgi:hypothetical protein
MKPKEKYILLTFDIEEFDLPLEYGHKISLDEQWALGFEGVKEMKKILENHQLPATLFTTANFTENFPLIIQELSEKNEIASHSYFHSDYSDGDLLKSKKAIERIISKPVKGIRMPRMESLDLQSVYAAGYLYDSSINPTWIPGRYNHFFTPRRLYKKEGVIRLPASVSPHIRIPLFWLTFKNFPLKLFSYLVQQTLNYDGYVCLYFHPWELTDLDRFQIPGYIKRVNGAALRQKLNTFLEYFKKEACFVTIESFLQMKKAEDVIGLNPIK